MSKIGNRSAGSAIFNVEGLAESMKVKENKKSPVQLLRTSIELCGLQLDSPLDQ